MSTTTMKERVTEWRETNPLRIRRKAEGLSLMECASALGAGQSSVQLWENGAQQPGPDAMAAIAKFLGISATTATRRWEVWHRSHPSRAA